MSQEKIYKNGIANRLRVVARDNALGQRGLAHKLGCSTTNMNRYWNAISPPPAELLFQICNTFDVDPGWLLSGETSDGKQAESDPIDLETIKLLAKARAVLESKNKPLVEALTNNINAFHEVVMPAQQITTEQAFDIVVNKLIFFCPNPACGKEVGSFTSRKKLSDICPFCGEVTNAKTYAEQIAALRVHLDETDDPKQIYRKAIAQDRAPRTRKSNNSSHR